ncbi:MAG: YopX family protein [bacterium]|nr:YopX family protein [bacterium]
MYSRFNFRLFDKKEKTMKGAEGVYRYSDFSTKGGEVFPEGVNTSLYFPEEAILMQCTGLRDKNGKLIFEGDIVHKKGAKNYKGEKMLARIIFSNDTASFNYSDENGSHDFRNGTSLKMEILGNIYENPELLKGD